jgi:hypothetical protein
MGNAEQSRNVTTSLFVTFCSSPQSVFLSLLVDLFVYSPALLFVPSLLFLLLQAVIVSLSSVFLRFLSSLQVLHLFPSRGESTAKPGSSR